jgi:hypothetical protein
MTVVCNLATVADSISKLSVSGVTIKDINEIPQSARGLCPVVLPQPSNFLSDVAATFQSFGSNGAARIDLSYTLTYVYLHCEAGSGVSQYDIYAGLITNLAAIIVAILSNDALTGLVDLKLGGVGSVGVIEDPSAVKYWGVIFTLNVLEFAQ